MKNIFYTLFFLSIIYGCSDNDNSSQTNPDQSQNKIYLSASIESNQVGEFYPPNHIGIYRDGNRINKRNQNNGNESLPIGEVHSGENIIIRYEIGLNVSSTATMKYSVMRGNTELAHRENSITNENPMASGHEFFNIIIP